jgi:hypothetical protein
MSQAPLCSSSGESIVLMRHIPDVTLIQLILRNGINIYEKRIVRQVGYLQELRRNVFTARYELNL